MLHVITLWVLAAIIILALVTVTLIRSFRKDTGVHQKLWEWNGEDPIHYEQDEEEL
ncbi:MAG: hypothetical protein Q4E59_07130 [Bacteroidales bacterium]|nr:hypothetical protein [Bacteroidales bacterium]